MRVRFRLEAAADVETARAWYDEQRGGLGDEFVEALEHAIEPIITLPHAFPEIAAGHRALLLRFPDSLYYRVELDVIDVLALRRAPEYTALRLRTAA